MEGMRSVAMMLVAGSVLLAACGSADDPEAAAVSGAATIETTPAGANAAEVRPAAVTVPATSETTATSTTFPPTATTSPRSGPEVLASIRYPYALTVPAEEIFRPFRPASSSWNGTVRVVRGTSFIDEYTFTNGGMHVLGVEWLEDLAALAQMFIDHGEQRNGCSQAKDQREAMVGGAPALLLLVDSCGLGSDNLTFVRLIALHDGFGLIAFTETLPGRESADMDRLLAYFSGVEWRTG